MPDQHLDKRLKGKFALITGGASGIGEAIAVLFTRHGAKVAIADIDEERGRTVATREGIEFIQVDLSDRDATIALIPRAEKVLGGLNVLVNGAAFFGVANKKTVVDTSLPVWDHTLAVNLIAPVILAQGVVPVMIRAGGGSIIHVASIGGDRGAFPEFAAYSVSKAALIQLARTLALDFGRHGIRANSICPGAIDTPGNAPFVQDREVYLETIAATTSVGRIGLPGEVAQAALFLASDESAYVSGITLVVDGGRTTKA